MLGYKFNVGDQVITTDSIPKLNLLWGSNAEIVRGCEERMGKLRAVSGYDIEKLIELFAAGWTLEPPKQTMTMEEMRKALELDEEND